MTEGAHRIRRRRHPDRDACDRSAIRSRWSRRRPCSSTTRSPRNIAYGAPGASADEIEAAARAAHAHEFIVHLAGRLPGAHRRARPAALGRPAAAAGDRARDSQGLAAAGARRSDLVARRRVRAAGAGRAGQPHAEPDDVRDRAPALDRPPRRLDHRARKGPRRRDRHPRRARGATRAASTRGCTRFRRSKIVARWTTRPAEEVTS